MAEDKFKGFLDRMNAPHAVDELRQRIEDVLANPNVHLTNGTKLALLEAANRLRQERESDEAEAFEPH